MNEAQLKPLFDQWGNVRDVMILRERSTGLSRGCAFVGYDSNEEAQAAIQHLDRRVHLPGAVGPLEVRFARGRQAMSASSQADDSTSSTKPELFFSGAPPTATEADLKALFSGQTGTVESLSLTRDPETGQSRGCGLVVMGSRQEAAAVIEALDGKMTLDGASAPLSVKWAEADKPAQRGSKASDGPVAEAEDRTVFFARVLRSASEDAVRSLFVRFGRVAEVNLFRAFQGAPTSKGCGLVTMGSMEEATAAIQGLHEQHVWQGMAQPMVVRWMDAALQRRRREEHLGARQQALLQATLSSPDSWPAGPAAPGLLPPGPAAAAPQQQQLGGSAAPGLLHAHDMEAAVLAAYAGVPSEVPPPGCAPDAYKLFIGNLPLCYSERELRPLFESVGQVVELVVLYDKQTGASKGSAFCWYATRADAARAAQQLNERHLLPDPTGQQQRPLVVRAATVRRSVPRAALAQAGAAAAGARGLAVGGAMGSLGAAGGAQQHAAAMRLQAPQVQAGRLLHPISLHEGPGAGGFGGGQFLLDGSGAFATSAQMAADAALHSGSFAIGAGGGGANSAGDSGSFAAMTSSSMAMNNAGSANASSNSAGAWEQQVFGGAAAAAAAAAAAHQQQLQYVPMSQQQQRLAPPQRASVAMIHEGGAPGGGGGGGGGDLVTLQVPLLSDQLGAVTPHVFNIQGASGAEVTTHAVAPGVFCLKLSGTKLAVDAASQLIASVIQGAT